MTTQKKSNYSILANTYTRPQFEEVIEFDDRYIRDKLSSYILSGYENLVVHAPYKSGKTHGVGWQLAMAERGPVSIVIIAYRGLCISTASALSKKTAEFGAPKKIIDYQQIDEKYNAGIDAIVTTFNSLPKVMDAIGSRAVNFAVLDESEHGAKFLTSNAIENKSEFQIACNELSSRARRVLVLDANAKQATETLIKYYFPDRFFTKLVNKGQPWKGHTFSQYDDETQGFALINDLVSKGKKLFISSSSRSQAMRIYEHFLTNLRISSDDVLCAFDGKSEIETYPIRLEEAKINPDKFADYNFVIGSPALATGISIEVENHFDRTLLFAVQDKDTPDPIQVMQQAFRVRNIKEKHIDLIYCDTKRGKPISLKQADDQYKERLAGKELLESYGVLNQAQIDAWMLAGNYAVEIADYNRQMFDSYLETIVQSFEDLGITEKNVEPYAAGDALTALGQQKVARGNLEESKKENILSAEDISDSFAKELQQKAETKSLKLSESSQLDRYRIINDYHFSSDQPSDEQVRTYMEWAEQGVSSGAYNLANAIVSKSEINRYLKAKNTDNSGLKKLDATSNRDTDLLASHNLDRVLADMISFKLVDGKYSFNHEREYSLEAHIRTTKNRPSKRSFYMGIRSELVGFEKVNPELGKLTKKIDEKPIYAVMELLKSRFKLDVRKVRGKDAFKLSPDQPVIEHLKNRQKAGLMSGIFQGLTTLSAGNKALAIRNKVKIDAETQYFIIRCLSSVSIDKHAELTTKYLEIALDSYGDKGNWSGVRDANIMMTERTGYSVKPC